MIVSTKSFSELLQDPGCKDLLKSLQYRILPQEQSKRKDLRKKAFSSVAAKIQNSNVLSSRWLGTSSWKTAALLAWEGHLTSVENMRIMNISIRDIPRDHMEKLASVVTDTVNIHRINHADQVGSILASVQCTELWLSDMELSGAETWALVTAMRDRVQCVRLLYYTLDIEELTQYDGQGRCRKLRVGRDMWTRYGDRLMRWWAVEWRGRGATHRQTYPII